MIQNTRVIPIKLNKFIGTLQLDMIHISTFIIFKGKILLKNAGKNLSSSKFSKESNSM